MFLFNRAYFGNLNFFGGPSTTSVKSSVKLKEIEGENSDAMMVFMSDVWLDKVKVNVVLNRQYQVYTENN